MDAAQVLQAVLSAVQSGTPIGDATPVMNIPPAARPTGVGLGPDGEGLPSSLPQMIFMLLSMSAVRDWIKLFLIGALLEGARRALTKGWEKLTDYVWVTATFETDDDPADWLMYWLSKRKVFQSARNVEVGAQFFGLDNLGVDDLGKNEDDEYRVSFMPSLKKTYSMWYKGRYMTIKRERSNEGWRRPIEYLEVRMLTRDPGLLRELLIEARAAYKVASEHLISVYVAESAGEWRLVAMPVKRPPCSVILDPGVLELIIKDAKDFLGSKKWYSDRGIPFRRGYLLYGVPGAGKTSLIHSIAGELGLSVYILSLTVASLDDNSLKALIGRMPRACIVLIEDIDAAFTRGMKRDIADPEAQVQAKKACGAPPPGPEGERGEKNIGKGGNGKDGAAFNGVTLSGLLNALDGIAAHEGRLLFATTNDYAALDAALLRPGRLDLHVEFQLASRYQASELFKRFYASFDDEGDSVADSEDGAVEGLEKADSEPSAVLPDSVSSAYMDLSLTNAPAAQLSTAQAAELAERFAEIVPPRMFSMATLQGYLMAYKMRPYVAIQDAPAWVEKKLKEKAAQVATAVAKNVSTAI